MIRFLVSRPVVPRRTASRPGFPPTPRARTVPAGTTVRAGEAEGPAAAGDGEGGTGGAGTDEAGTGEAGTGEAARGAAGPGRAGGGAGGRTGGSGPGYPGAPVRRSGGRPGPLSPYRRLFAPSGALAFTLAAFPGRLATSMLGVSTVVMLALVRDSYALAGAVSAVNVTVTAVTGPLLGRLVDRLGQTRVAVPATLVFALGTAAMLLCVRYDAPAWALFLCCAGNAGIPSVGSMARARWAALHGDDAEARHTANSFEQVVDELCFMLGPALAMVLCTAVFPEAGLLTAAVLLTGGMLLFAGRRDTEPPVRKRTSGMSGGPLRAPGFPALLLVFAATGALFGSLEVATVAAVQTLGGGSAAAGLVLALQAAGSGVAGLAFGALRLSGSPAVRLAAGVAAMTVCTLPLTAAGSLPLLAVLLFVAGMATAPTMVTGMSLVQRLVPDGRLNEGMTTAYTGLLTGIAAGAAAGGQFVERWGAPGAYWAPVAAGTLALLAALAGLPRLRRV
ncbi:MFS transporter [Streptomyces xinghaiensis]|nr:transporter [Streptomyces fradiae]PQM22674.1 MFS transporter [Streptomyces xinghaiensis]